MADNNQSPPLQQNDPQRQAPGQQQKQGEPKPNQPGHNPGGQADPKKAETVKPSGH